MKFSEKIFVLFLVLNIIVTSCSKENQKEELKPTLLRTVESVSESFPLTYAIKNGDESLLSIFLGQNETAVIRNVRKVLSVGSKLYILRGIPDEHQIFWPEKLLLIECNTGNFWAFDYDIESFFANDEFIIINKKGSVIENSFYVDVISADDFSILSEEDLFSKIKFFPPEEINSEFSKNDGLIQLKFFDQWDEEFANFTFVKSDLNWKENPCNYSKDFSYIPSDAIFCEANHYWAYKSFPINEEKKVSLEDNRLVISNTSANSEIYSQRDVVTYKIGKSKKRMLIICASKANVENIHLYDLENDSVIRSFEANEKAICDEDISKILYKSSCSKIKNALHYFDLEKNKDTVISLKKIIRKNKKVVDFDFVSFKYPDCGLLFNDIDGLEYYVDFNLLAKDGDLLPANRYEKPDLSKYPSLH